jgi:hypothetical protein
MTRYEIRGSVGQGGRNQERDVLLVQRLLNHCLGMLIPLARLAEDGRCGPHTILAITTFQQRWVRRSGADGRMDPYGPTFRRLVESVEGALPPTPGDMPPPAPRTSSDSPLVWGAKVSPAFRKKVVDISARLGTQPDYLMACMAFESAGTFDPAKRNAVGSGAVGLIQFMPSTAKGLGTSVDALAAMSPEEQLDYVEKYFVPQKGKVATIEDLYMAILWPRAVGKALEYVLFEKPSTAYTQNSGLDHNGDGKVTKFEAAASVRAMLTKGKAYSA